MGHQPGCVKRNIHIREAVTAPPFVPKNPSLYFPLLLDLGITQGVTRLLPGTKIPGICWSWLGRRNFIFSFGCLEMKTYVPKKKKIKTNQKNPPNPPKH